MSRPILTSMQHTPSWEVNSTLRYEDSGSMFLRIVGICVLDRTTLLPKRPTPTSRTSDLPCYVFLIGFTTMAARACCFSTERVVEVIFAWQPWGLVLSLDTLKLITFAANEWYLREKTKYKLQGVYNVCMYVDLQLRLAVLCTVPYRTFMFLNKV